MLYCKAQSWYEHNTQLKGLIMKTKKKASTIYFQAETHRALKLQSALRELSISDLAEEIIKESLEENKEDLKTFQKRKKEISISFRDFVQTLKRNGKI